MTAELFTPRREGVTRSESFVDNLPLDGRVIPIGKNVRRKDLTLMVRHVKFPFTPFGDGASYHDPKDSYLLFNMFGKEGDLLVNVGFIDGRFLKESHYATINNSMLNGLKIHMKLSLLMHLGWILIEAFSLKKNSEETVLVRFLQPFLLLFWKNLMFSKSVPVHT